MRLHFSPANVAHQTHFTLAVEAVLVVVQKFGTTDETVAVGVAVAHNIVRGNGQEGNGPLKPSQQICLARINLKAKCNILFFSPTTAPAGAVVGEKKSFTSCLSNE